MLMGTFSSRWQPFMFASTRLTIFPKQLITSKGIIVQGGYVFQHERIVAQRPLESTVYRAAIPLRRVSSVSTLLARTVTGISQVG